MVERSRRGSREESGNKPKTSYRGSAGLRRMEEEQKKAEARKEANKVLGSEPFRFFLTPGETREIIIVDEAPDFFRNEHALKNPKTNRFNLFTPCIDEEANCPACSASDKPAYYAMYLTVIDNTPYTNRDGDEIEWSKKMLVVKLSQQKKIARLYEKHGTLRGMVLEMTRDGDKDAAIGNDIEFVEFIEEEEFDDFVSEYTDKDGKVHEILGGEPFDYESIYPDVTEKQLRAIVGGQGSAGNRDDDDQELGRSRRPSRGNLRKNRDEEEEQRRPSRRGPEEEEEEEQPRRRTSSRRGRDEEEEEEQPTRRASRRPSREEEQEEQPRRASRRRQEPDDEEEQEERPRRAARRAAKDVDPDEQEDRPQRSGSRRRSQEQEEDEPEEATAKTSAAGRRAALRPSGRR